MESSDSIPIIENIQTNLPALERSTIVALVRQFGGCTSDAVLDPKMSYFTHPDISGFISYRQSFRCAVVLGDPVCDLEQRASLTKAFHEFAKALDWSIVYIAASHSFSQWAVEHVCPSLIEFGEELIYDPSEDPKMRSGTQGSLVRRKVKRAIKEGVVVHEYKEEDLRLRSPMEELGKKWLRSRRGPQIYISSVYLFQDSQGKRWLYAQVNNEIVGSISLNQLQAHSGWLINHLMVLPEAPNGTSELLFTSALEILNKEGYRFATVGAVTAKQLGQMQGFSRGAEWVAKNIFGIAKKIYDLDGLHMFWGKFNPQKKPIYILLSRKGIGPRELLGISRAMNGPI